MTVKTLNTPLFAAFFYFLLLNSIVAGGAEIAVSACDTDSTPIAEIQGNRFVSPLVDQQVTVQGVITLIEAGKGLYIEQADSDQSSRTSNAMFIQFNNQSAEYEPGWLVSATGTVSELGKRRNTLTSLTAVDGLTVCATGLPLPRTAVALPLDVVERESLEGMRILLNGQFTVSDAYQLDRDRFTISGNGIQFVPTEVGPTGMMASVHRQQNRSYALPARRLPGSENDELLIAGSAIGEVAGVLGHDGGGLRVFVQSSIGGQSPEFLPANKPQPGDLRVVGMNLHNYFNGDGKGGEFPTPRGAKTLVEFEQQRSRIGAAIKVLDPHVIGVMELENDGFGSAGAAADFIRLATESTGGEWAASIPDAGGTGGDKIAVGIFYRKDLLQAVGDARTLEGPEFKRSRQPLAQVFKSPGQDEQILVVINHLKSKGSCPKSGENANKRDGQGCWNAVRLASAVKMTAWATRTAAAAKTDNILILGDMNAYRNEDPVHAIRNAGYTELMDDDRGQVYSFMFFGQAGTLDYAFVSGELLPKVQNAFIWNVNAALPARMDFPQPWLRFSDHDPVVVDIRWRQAVTSD